LVGLLWTSDQPVAKASTCTGQHIHALSGIRTHDLSAIKAYVIDRAATGAGVGVCGVGVLAKTYNVCNVSRVLSITSLKHMQAHGSRPNMWHGIPEMCGFEFFQSHFLEAFLHFTALPLDCSEKWQWTKMFALCKQMPCVRSLKFSILVFLLSDYTYLNVLDIILSRKSETKLEEKKMFTFNCLMWTSLVV
jgi:hypothetical protein